MDINLLKKKHNIPLSEEIYVITIQKDEKEIGEDGVKEWVTYLREPNLQEEENLLNIISTKMLTGTQLALQSLYLDGDKFYENKKLIKSSMRFVTDLFNAKEAVIEKK
jgi:hypothetical protein